MPSTKGHPVYAGAEKGWIKKGSKLSDETKQRMSATRKELGTRPPSPKGREMSDSTKEKLRQANLGKKRRPMTDAEKKHLSDYWTGRRKPEDHWSWKGGVTSDNYRIRRSAEYKRWRIAVFERDNYTCQICCKRGGRLNADHIKPFADYPELRFELDNGRTLCEPCHKKTETWGWNIHNKRKVTA